MKILEITSRTVSIEMSTNKAYFFDNDFDIFINNKFYRKEKRNIFTIFNLMPDTIYEIKINNELHIITTLSESCCLHIKDFHAIGDGIIDDTAKIQAAIMCAPKNACVYIDKGSYLVTSLFLKSDITIYFESGSKLIAKTNRTDFPIFPGCVDGYNYGVWEGSEVDNFASIINVINCENVKICGEGEIDSNALNGDWYVNHRVKNIAWRGHAIFTNRSNNISVIGLYVHDTQSWAIHPYFTSNLSFINLSIKNKASMPTTDGIDPDVCDDVKILGCVFDVGDDCIAIKSGTYELAKKYRRPCENIIIRNNHMVNGHGGVVFGSESSGGIKNVFVSQCLFEGIDRGLRIKTRRGRGNIGSIDNVDFDNIVMNNVKTPFVINMYYNMGPKGGHEEYVWTHKCLPVDEFTPVIGKLKFTNMICNGVEYAAGVFLGLPESQIEEVEFENVVFNYNNDCVAGYPVMIEHNFTLKNAGLYSFNVKSIITNNVKFNGVCGNEIFNEIGE